MIPAERSVPRSAGSPTFGLAAAGREADEFEQAPGAGAVQDLAHAASTHWHSPHALAGSFVGRTFRRAAHAASAPSMTPEVRNEAGRLLHMTPADLAEHLRRLLPGAQVPAAPVLGVFGSGALAERRRLAGG